MATYFSINNGNFTGSGVFAKTLPTGDVTGGTTPYIINTTYSDQPLFVTDGTTIYGVAVQLSGCATNPTGTLDLRLSAAGGSVSESFPISNFTSYLNSDTIPTYNQCWQLLTLTSPLTTTNGANLRISLKSSVANQISLFGSIVTNLNKYVVLSSTSTPTSGDVVHVGGCIKIAGAIPSTITYNNSGSGYFNSFFVHKGGTLNFDSSTSCNLYVSGTNGFQISPEGVVNIGTSSSSVPANINHTIGLNGFLNVHTGGVLNVYGAPKTQFGYLASNTTTSTRSFSTVNGISNWRASDFVVLAPASNGNISDFDVVTLSSVDSSTNFKTIAVPSYSHTSSSFIPTGMNMTRNVKFKNLGSSNSFLRSNDAGILNINNAELTNFQTSVIKVASNSSGSISMSSCAVSGANSSVTAFTLETGKTSYINFTANDNNFYNLGNVDVIKFDSVSANNISIKNNVCMKSGQNGTYFNSFSASNAYISNNWGIGASSQGFYINNLYNVGGYIGGFGYRCGGSGSYVKGTSVVGNINGFGGFYNYNCGSVIEGTIGNINSVTFSNISASNNTLVGVAVSGNSPTLTSPITLNVNGVVANNNDGVGFEGYSITGNLSSMTLNNNYGYGIKTSIGNAATVFDGVSSEGTVVSGNRLTKTGTTLSAASPFGVGTDSSIGFNGTSDYLTLDSNKLPATGQFTIEGWLYTTKSTGTQVVYAQYEYSNSNRCYIGFDQTGIGFGHGDSNANTFTTGLTIPLNNWFHFAVTRDASNVMRVFLDGVLGATKTVTNTLYTGSAILGQMVQPSGPTLLFTGYMSNIRFSNTALYTQSFNTSAPISPLTPLTLLPNTVFLYNDPYGTIYKDVNSGVCAFGILSAQNYFPTVIKSAKLTTSTLSGYKGSAILLDSSKFEQFTVESSTLSSYQDVKTLANRNYVEGSYQFNNCTFNNGILSSTLANYQPEIFLETGFAAMKVGGVSTNHFRWTPSGKISSDTVRYYGTNGISEKLEPISATKKLRCGSKLIPVNYGDTHTISVYVYSTAPTPRLMLKKNASLGYSDTVLATTGTTGSWVLLTGSIPAAASAGIFEVYVDCSGTSGSVNVDNWTLI